MKPLKVKFERAVFFYRRKEAAHEPLPSHHKEFNLYDIQKVKNPHDDSTADEAGKIHILHAYKLFEKERIPNIFEYYLSEDEYDAIQEGLTSPNVSSITINLSYKRIN